MAMSKEESTKSLLDTLNDSDLTTLAVSNSMDSSGDFETLDNIQAELESMNAEESQMEEEHQQQESSDTSIVISENNISECILPDVEMTEVVPPEVESEQVVYTTASPTSGQNLVMQTRPTLQRIPASIAAQTKEEPQAQSLMILSPSGGGVGQIIKLSHPSTASPNQLQTMAQTIITAKTSDGNLVQIRPAPPKPSTATITKSTTTTVAAKTGLTETTRKVYGPKIVVTNEQSQQQQVFITSSGTDNQKIKLLVNANSPKLGTSMTKAITIDQAQQMGLIRTTKVPGVQPVAQKNSNFKVVQTGQTGKYTLVQTGNVKSPTKILPAPAAPQSKTISVNKPIQPNTQKVIIRQSGLKTLPGGNQIIRIPANRAIAPNQIHQIQVGSGQQAVQYMRVVNTPTSGSSNIVTVAKAKPASGLTTMSSPQKINNSVVKVLPLNSGNQSFRQVAPKASMSRTSTQRLIIPAAPGKSTVAIPASALSQLTSGQAVLSTTDGNNLVVVPSSMIQQQVDTDIKPIIKTTSTPTLLNSSQSTSLGNLTRDVSEVKTEIKLSKSFNTDSNGIRPRKPCNCTKSQCLKLYCDCFANGEFCHMCNCNNCSNNLGNEEERQRAIRSCLERNPNAFRPKIGKARDVGEDVRRHNKGCNCKRSGCLKNYCECYEAKIPCSDNCKCIGCRNVEEPNMSQSSLSDLADAVEARSTQQSNKSRLLQFSDPAFRPPATSNTGARQPFNFLTDKVVEMTCQCLLAQAEEAERNMLDEETSQKIIIEEYGRCLKEIIESAQKAEAT